MEADLYTAVLLGKGLGVEVVTAVIASWAGVERAIAVGDGAIAADGETWCCLCSFVTLLLRGWRSQDAAAAVIIDQA